MSLIKRLLRKLWEFKVRFVLAILIFAIWDLFSPSEYKSIRGEADYEYRQILYRELLNAHDFHGPVLEDTNKGILLFTWSAQTSNGDTVSIEVSVPINNSWQEARGGV